MTIHSSITAGVLRRIVMAATAVAATVGPAVLLAQVVAPAADAPVFEAASIRPAADTGRRGGRGTPGRFTGFNLPARQLIRQAYDINDAQIVGGPDWIATQGFDINATFNSNLNGAPTCLGGVGWYLGYDGNEGSNIELLPVVLHELGHGLGFSAQVSQTGVEPGTPPYPTRYERFIRDNTQ